MKDKGTKIVRKSAKTAAESKTSCCCSCGCGSAESLTTRKSKKVGISDAEPKIQQGLALESNSNKKEMDV
jgi:BRCT domain type II-containing protein